MCSFLKKFISKGSSTQTRSSSIFKPANSQTYYISKTEIQRYLRQILHFKMSLNIPHKQPSKPSFLSQILEGANVAYWSTIVTRREIGVASHRAPLSRQAGTRVNSPKCTHSFLYMPATRASPCNPRSGRIQCSRTRFCNFSVQRLVAARPSRSSRNPMGSLKRQPSTL